MVRGSNNCQLSEAIYNIPPELREFIYKEYLAMKMRQRAALGWDEVHKALHKEYLAIKMRQRAALGWEEVHQALQDVPFCEERARIANVFFCRKCNTCGRNGLCTVCFKNWYILVYNN